ncbi:NAD-dependent epimerase/dehydratase family protein [Candidatus Ruminimicrobium bovinum]|uniref:NAD-dependent epimerase/dehydratase family protein n=1 Tax=Candidatus Ruminimicrobium bovinum TaxID=3242779 RepID=UPI0039B932BD
MRVLLTGATGFVGSHILEKLLSDKNEVVCPVRKTSNLHYIENCNAVIKYGDLDDDMFIEQLISSVDVVVHCAGLVRALKFDDYYKVNTAITAKLVEAVKNNKENIKKFIYISSQSAVGPSLSNVPKDFGKEEPVSDYGKTKLFAEQEVKKLEGFVPYVILRPAAVYGPRDKDIFTVFKIVHNKISLKTISKHFVQVVYVEDIAKIISQIIKSESYVTDNKIYSVCDGKIYSWKDIADTIAKVNYVPIRFTVPVFDFVFKLAGIFYNFIEMFTKKPQVLSVQKVGEILKENWIIGNEKIVSDIGFEFEKLETGAIKTYNWYKENKWF